MRDIYFVVETGSLAGGVRVIGEIANRLAARDWKVRIFSVNPKETLTAWFHLDHRVEWVSFFRTGTVADYDEMTEILKRQTGYKVATFWRTAYSVKEAAKEGEGDYLIQDIETVYVHGPMLTQLVLDTYKFGLRMVTTSRWVEKQLGCEYVGIGIDHNFFKPKDNVKRKGYPLAIARRQALKGWGELCEVSRNLQEAGVRLHTFGLDKKLNMFAQPEHHSRPTDESVRLYYNEAGVFISTSLHEGFALGPLEAMACLCPVVKSRDDGSDEYIEPGENCLVGETPKEIAKLALQVLEDKALARKLSQQAILTPRRYTWKAVIDRLETLFT